MSPGRAVPAGVVIILRVDEAAGLQLAAHHGGGAVVAWGVLPVPLQFGVPVDPGDCKSTTQGQLQAQQGSGGTGSSRIITPTALQEELPAKTKLFAGPDPPQQLEKLSCPFSTFSTFPGLSFWASHEQDRAWKITIKVSGINKKLCHWEGTNKSSLSLASIIPAALKS